MIYYEPKNLADFPNITEWAQKEGGKFFEYYGAATGSGRLTERVKSLIALTVAMTQNGPYCIDAYTTQYLSLGLSSEEMVEAKEAHKVQFETYLKFFEAPEDIIQGLFCIEIILSKSIRR